MIRFTCSRCDTMFKLDDASAGRSGRCQNCGEPLVVPQHEANWIEKLPRPLAEIADDLCEWLKADSRRVWGVGTVVVVLVLAVVGYWNAHRPQPSSEEPSVDVTAKKIVPAKTAARPKRRRGKKKASEVATRTTKPVRKAVGSGTAQGKPQKPKTKTWAVKVRMEHSALPVPKHGIWRLEKESAESANFVAGATPNGRLLAYYVNKLTVKVVDTEKMVEVARITFPQETNTFHPAELFFSPNGETLAIARLEYVGTRIGIKASRKASMSIWLYDTRTWKKRGLLSGPNDWNGFYTSYVRHAAAWAFSSASDRIAVAFGGDVHVYDAYKGSLLQAWRTGKQVINGLTFAGKDNWLVTGGEEGVLRVRNLVTRETETVRRLRVEIRRVQVTPNDLLIVELENRIRESFGFQLDQGRLARTLWIKPGVVLAADGKRFACLEPVGMSHGTVPAVTLYDAEKSFEWQEVLPAPQRLRGPMMFVGEHLVSRCNFGQVLVFHPDQRWAVAVGEIRLRTKPSIVSTANANNLGVTWNTGNSGQRRGLSQIWPVGNRLVLAAYVDGRVDLIDVMTASEWVRRHPPAREVVVDGQPRVWTTRLKRRVTGRLVAINDGILELSVKGRGNPVEVPYLSLSDSDQMDVAGSRLQGMTRLWRPIGAGPIRGRAVRYQHPHVEIKTDHRQTITIPVTRILREDRIYLEWLRERAQSRLVPMVQHVCPAPTGRVTRAKATEAGLQGVWQVVQGINTPMPAKDRFVFVVGNVMFVPMYLARQRSQWARQRYCAMTDLKPHKRLDRFQGAGNYHGSIYELNGNTLRLQFGIARMIPNEFGFDAWTLKRVRKSIRLDEVLRHISPEQETQQ